MTQKEDFLYKEETYKILGCCFEVYKEIGNGLLEAVYQECLEHEFRNKEIQFLAQPWLEIEYKGEKLKQTYKPDFICYNKIILEIKAASQLVKEHEAQIINYLKLTHLKIGLLVNFGHFPKLEYKRFIL